MIEQPNRYVEAFVHAGVDTIIVHQENTPHLDRTVQLIKCLGKKAGVALNPSTPAGVLEEIIEEVDLVLVMTVNPGFGGQRSIERVLRKIEQVRQMLDRCNAHYDLEVDGGIDAQTSPQVVEAGARVLVAGTAIFGHADGPEAGLQNLMQIILRREVRI